MIDRRDLARALDRRGAADWIVIDRDQELAIVDETSGLRRVEHRSRWQLTAHVDTANGRGSAHVMFDASEGSADAIAKQAIDQARATIGPAWASTAMAAPAKVVLIDDTREPIAIADALLHAAKRPPGATVTARASCLHEHVTATARDGFHTSWSAALLRVEALVAAGERSLHVACEARRAKELELDAALAGAARDAEALAGATDAAPGACAVVLSGDAMLDGGLGVWQAFAFQADAVVERQGLARYRERMPIAAGADQVPEPLSIASDGALDFGVRSAPIGDEGDAVRRFPIVERGVAAGLGLSPREAALRHRDPNGGVRNLVVASGSWMGEPGGGRVVEVRRLRELAIDRYTGDARLEIALALEGGRAITGGTLRLDLISALAHARRAAARLRRGPYDGPSAVFIDRAELVS